MCFTPLYPRVHAHTWEQCMAVSNQVRVQNSSMLKCLIFHGVSCSLETLVLNLHLQKLSFGQKCSQKRTVGDKSKGRKLMFGTQES